MKIFKMAGLIACLALFVIIAERAIHARITGTQPTVADIACWGPDGAEGCLDSSGNFVPTTDNDTTLGSSTLRWSDVRAFDATFADDVAVTGNLTIGADFQPFIRTSTQLQTLVPSASGYIVVNITEAMVCMSTGTGAGAWIAMSTSTTGNLTQCY